MFSLFRSYLSNRSQCVQLDGQKSSSSNITCGVPQGSILVYLFVPHINVFNYCTNVFKFINLSDLAVKMNTDLRKVLKWRPHDRLSLNASKLFFTVLSSIFQANLCDLSINGISSVHSTTTKFLVKLVDNKLNFAHI